MATEGRKRLRFEQASRVLVHAFGIVAHARDDRDGFEVSQDHHMIAAVARHVPARGNPTRQAIVDSELPNSDAGGFRLARWQELSLAFGASFLPNAVTFGNAVHLVAGNGGLRLSADAESWQTVAIDCALTSACISDPDGHSQNILRTATFADGAFYVNSLKSFDGIALQTNNGATPVERVGDCDFAVDPT
jgi:hypothetical protein